MNGNLPADLRHLVARAVGQRGWPVRWSRMNSPLAPVEAIRKMAWKGLK